MMGDKSRMRLAVVHKGSIMKDAFAYHIWNFSAALASQVRWYSSKQHYYTDAVFLLFLVCRTDFIYYTVCK